MPSGTDIAKAYVQIIPSAEGIKGKLEDILGGEADTAGRSAGNRFSNIFGAIAKGGLAALGAAAAGVAALTNGAVSSFAEYEQLVGGSKLMFGDAYDFIAEKAASAWENVQMSQNDYLEQVNGFATGLKTALGGNSQLAAELADKIVTAEADVVAATGNSREAVENAFNGIMKSNFTMLDNLQLGITPTKEGFQSLIDQVNEWNAANGESTNYVIDNVADCQAALVDYIEMQGLAGYAAGEGASTIQGSLSATQAAFQNLLTGMADGSADLSVLIDNLVSSATNLFDNLVPVIMRSLEGIEQLVVNIAPKIGAALPQMLTTLLPALTTAAFNLLLAFADGLVQNLPVLLDAALQMIPTIITGLAQALPQLVSYIPQLVIAIAQTIIQNFPQIVSAGKELVGALLQSILSLLGQMISAGRQLLSSVVSGISGAISSVVSIGRNIVQGIWNGISGALGWIKGMIQGWVGDVLGFIKRLFKIGSPSKVMADEVGIYLAEGIGVGFEDGMTDVEQAMQNSMPDLQSMIQPVDVPVDFSTSGAALRGYAAVQTQNAPDPTLMDELRSIRRDLTNLRVYLDTGVLVGAVNSGLGSEYLATKRRALA